MCPLFGMVMRKILAGMDDFKNEKSLVEHYLVEKGHVAVFLPKFHPELNPIERVWARVTQRGIVSIPYSPCAKIFRMLMTR